MISTAPSSRSPLRAPFNVCLWLTDTCNLSCKYCYAMPFSGKVMPSARLLEVVDELADMGVFDITLAGGEPLVHPDCVEVVRRSVARGLRVGLLTNGLLLTPDVCDRLADAGRTGDLIVQVSIDSADPTIGDRTRGNTAKAIEGISNAVAAGLEVQLSTVLTSANIDTAHLVIDRFYPGVKRFHFLNVQKTERAYRHPELFITDDACQNFWLHLNEHRKSFPPDLFLPSLRVQLRAHGKAEVEPDFMVREEASFACSSCSAGLTHLNVDVDFNVMGCDIAKDFTWMGSAAEESFEAVYHSTRAHLVRAAPFPACYRIRSRDGSALEDDLATPALIAEANDAVVRPMPARRNAGSAAVAGRRLIESGAVP